MSEHDFEPIRGLPGALPEGEVVLWQGAPNWLSLSCRAFHIRAVAGYFGLMLAWRVGEGLASGEPVMKALTAAVSVAPIALAGLSVLAFFGWLNSRSTVYTITNKRVVMRFGAALTKAINIPFAIIEGAALKSDAQGAGDLALTLKAPNKIAFLQLWPHARPWRLAAPEPTFRCLADAQGAAEILANAMKSEVAIEMIRQPSNRGAGAPGALQPAHAVHAA